MSWDEENPHARFRRRLIRERAESLMRAPEHMRYLRYDNDDAVRHQKLFGEIWQEYGKTVYRLIADGYGESWSDSEDEQKAGGNSKGPRAPIGEKRRGVNQKDDYLVGARKESARLGQHELQGEPEASEQVVEERLGPAEAKGFETNQGQEKGGGRARRGAGFYRSAGGT